MNPAMGLMDGLIDRFCRAFRSHSWWHMSLLAWPWSIGENALLQMWFNLCHVQTLLSPWTSRRMIAHFYATEDWTVLQMLFLAAPALWRAPHWVLPPWHLCNTHISWGCNLRRPTLFMARRCGDWKVDIMHLIDLGGQQHTCQMQTLFKRAQGTWF